MPNVLSKFVIAIDVVFSYLCVPLAHAYIEFKI